MKWMEIAQSKIGVKEVPGSKHNQEIISWIRDDLGFNWYVADETPWCAGFANWCLKKAGEATTNSLMARSFLNYGVKSKPKYGAIMVFKRGQGNQGHVGFYVGETATHYKILGGNQNNAVNVSSYRKDMFIGARWPGRLAKSRIAQSNMMSLAGVGGSVVGENAEGISSFASTLTDGATQLQPLVDYSGYITAIFVALTLAGIGMSLYWRWYMMKRDRDISNMGGSDD